MGLATLEVDGVVFHLDYRGHDARLEAHFGGEAALRLEPWTLGRHLLALDRAARAREGRLELDPAVYAAQVLGEEALLDPWGPLALWWAAGEADGPVPDGYELRPWTLLERATAVQAALDPRSGAFHVGRYLGVLLAACVRPRGGPEPTTLPASRGLPLLAAAARLCAPEPLVPAVARDPAFQQLTLRICQALGWSPARVWQSPVGEIDQILALIEGAPAPARPTARRPSLADRPDTTTIRIDDD